MSTEDNSEPKGSKLADLLWVLIPVGLILLGLAALFGLTP